MPQCFAAIQQRQFAVFLRRGARQQATPKPPKITLGLFGILSTMTTKPDLSLLRERSLPSAG